MKTFSFSFSAEYFDLPESWNELQIVYGPATTMAAVMCGWSEQDAMKIKMAILRLLIGEHKNTLKILQEYPDAIQTILNEMDFLLDEDPDTGKCALAARLTISPFPVLENMPTPLGQPVHLYGPASGLDNITAYELALLFQCFEQFAADRTTAQIDRMIAITYRPSKPETDENILENFYGDRRQPLNEASIQTRQEQVAKLPYMLKCTIFFWLLSCRISIIEQFPAIFQEGRKGERSGADYGWWEVFRTTAGNLKDVEKIANLNWRDVLTELDYLETQRMRAEMQRAMNTAI